jgi:hypothetical protein
MAACRAVHGSEAGSRCNACPGYAIPNANSCSNNTETIYVKVRRHDDVTPTCSTYQLEVSNGVY